MWKDVQPRNPTLKRISTPLIFHLSPRVWGERVCVSLRVWRADELSVQGDEVTPQSDGVLQASVHQKFSGACSHFSSDTHTHTCFFHFFSFTTQSSKKLACCVKCKKKKKTQLNKIIKTDFVSWLVFNPELITSVYFCSRTQKKNNDLNEKCGVFLCCKHLVQRHVSQWCCINSSFNKSVRELRTAALDLKANPLTSWAGAASMLFLFVSFSMNKTIAR